MTLRTKERIELVQYCCEWELRSHAQMMIVLEKRSCVIIFSWVVNERTTCSFYALWTTGIRTMFKKCTCQIGSSREWQGRWFESKFAWKNEAQFSCEWMNFYALWTPGIAIMFKKHFRIAMLVSDYLGFSITFETRMKQELNNWVFLLICEQSKWVYTIFFKHENIMQSWCHCISFWGICITFWTKQRI